MRTQQSGPRTAESGKAHGSGKETEGKAKKPFDFKADVAIDRDNLEDELFRQSNLMWRYGKRVADLRVEMDRLKLAIDVKYASIANNIRAKPEKYGVEKVSNDAVHSAVIASQGYQEVYNEWLDARHEYDVVNAALTAIEGKRKSMDNLTRLLEMDYYSQEPSSIKHSADLRDKAKERSREKTHKALND